MREFKEKIREHKNNRWEILLININEGEEGPKKLWNLYSLVRKKLQPLLTRTKLHRKYQQRQSQRTWPHNRRGKNWNQNLIEIRRKLFSIRRYSEKGNNLAGIARNHQSTKPQKKQQAHNLLPNTWKHAIVITFPTPNKNPITHKKTCRAIFMDLTKTEYAMNY